MDSQLEALIDNAFDFLKRSIAEFEKDPKYSVIHFYTAVELFLKSRLMAEHWTLIVSRNQSPNLSAFRNGDFHSVSLDETIDLPENVVKSPISRTLQTSLKTLRNHRNTCVHFFHAAHTPKGKKEEKQKIAKEQLRVWYHLYNLMQKRDWVAIYTQWSEDISKVNLELKAQRAYLQVVYNEKLPIIEQHKKSGIAMKACPSCAYEALPSKEKISEITKSNCLVCDSIETRYVIQCVECEDIIVFINEGFGQCSGCGKLYEPEDLCDVISPPGVGSDALYETPNGNCAECDGTNTVVEISENRHFCTSCFEEFSELYTCDWCNEPNTRDTTASSILGCSHCPGSSNYD